MNEVSKIEECWFAARISTGGSIINNRLALDGIRCYKTKHASGILFMRCTMQYTTYLLSTFWGKIYFYLNAERKAPEPIPEREMNNFILVTSASDELISLGRVSEELLQGDRVRVKDGIFKGVEGVIKRIKGDRRLVVAINDFTAVATCYIKPELIERV